MKTLLFASLWVIVFSPGYSQKIARLEVDVARSTQGMTINAEANLDEITFLADSSLELSVIENGKKKSIPFQISHGKSRVIHWQVDNKNDGSKKRIFELSKGKASSFANAITATKKDGALTIYSGDKNYLRYWYKTVYPPAGIDTAFKRSGFIHPLWTPHGQELTRIQAPDHYHHYGIWNPWTHVLFEGDTVDFWNLKGRTGTVRFDDFITINNGPIYSEFAALHKHVAFKKNGKEKVALHEIQTVRVYKAEPSQDYFLVDVTIKLSCASESPFRILEYRYAGLGWRATEKWNKDNSEVLTSEGKSRKESDGTTAKWFFVQGALDSDYGGAVMMSHPSNYNYPEPLRIWPENSNNGEMFAMFAPTKTKDWMLEPGKTYVLKYRFVAYNGHYSKEKAESGWSYFATPAAVTVKKN